MEVPAAIEWLPGPRDLTYNDLVDTGRTVVGAMINRGIPG